MESVSYLWFFALFWLTCGVIGYSMWCGRDLYHGGKYYLAKSIDLILGPITLIHCYYEGWTEHDGMWL